MDSRKPRADSRLLFLSYKRINCSILSNDKLSKINCRMNKILQLFCTCFVSIAAFSQENKADIAIIPEPVSVVKSAGVFVLPQKVSIDVNSRPEMKQVIAFLKERLSTATGKPVIVSNSVSSTIKLILNKTPDAAIGNEGYRLSVTPKNIVIKANKPAGLFYGEQTLIQLFPREIESSKLVSNIKWVAPCAEITDYPRFEWRGLMFDVARHFFAKKDIVQYIDQMARYKFNLLHMH